MHGVAWATGANIGCQLMSLLFSFALARILSPRIFGLVALAWVYVAFMHIFVTQGFGVAIVQRKELENEHLNSAFWIGVGTALIFVIASIALADPITALFKEPKLAPIISWLSVLMILNAMGAVQTAILSRDLKFRPLAIRSLAATGISGVVGVSMALLGCGVWSLVGQQLLGAAIGCLFLWFAVPWRPQLSVSKRHIRDLYGFSINIIGNDILWFFSKRSDQTVVGYSFGPDGLGPYSLAGKIVSFITEGILGPLASVAFPTLCKLQSDAEKFEQAVYQFCELSTFLVFPLYAGIGCVAQELIPVVFGEKWIAAIPLLQVLALYGMMVAAMTFTFPAAVAKGRTGLQLVTSTIISCVTVLGCIAGGRFTPKMVAVSLIVSYALFSLVFLLFLRRILQIRPGPLVKRLFYPALSSLVMVVVVGFLQSKLRGWIGLPLTLSLSIVGGAALYIGAARIFRPDLVDAVQEAIKSILYRSAPDDVSKCLVDPQEELVSASAGQSEV